MTRRLEEGSALLETAAAVEHQAMYGGGGFHAPQLRRARALARQAADVYREALVQVPDDSRALSGLARALDFFGPTPAGATVRAHLAALATTAGGAEAPAGSG